MDQNKFKGFSTKAIHVGQKPEEQFGAVIPPIYMTSTFAQAAPGQTKGYDYTRAGNPNFTNFEEAIAALEHGKYATVLASGLSGITALATLLKPGDKVLGIHDLYGGTYRAFTKVFSNFNIAFDRHEMSDLDDLEHVLSKTDYALLLVESPTNPLLKVSDIEAICSLAKKYDTLSLVDNTFATPFIQNPLTLGADMVWHSTTKYIGGHSDVIGGVIITNEQHIKEQIDFARMSMGLNSSPFDVWVMHRGLKTLGLRMQQHSKSALELAKFLENNPLVEKVYYPGLESHSTHAIAKKQMNSFGGIVSVEFKLSVEDTAKLISSFEVFTLAESLGGIESLVDHPASMTHASIPKEERVKIGLTDGLVRFSVGIEEVDDLKQDLESALALFN